MSNSSKPRVLKLKKLPKGKFKWKVCFRLEVGHKMGFWDRYCDDGFVLPKAVFEYLEQQVHGRYCLHAMSGRNVSFDDEKYKKYDYILFENQLDVTMFKLCHGDIVRRIYRIETQ